MDILAVHAMRFTLVSHGSHGLPSTITVEWICGVVLVGSLFFAVWTINSSLQLPRLWTKILSLSRSVLCPQQGCSVYVHGFKNKSSYEYSLCVVDFSWRPRTGTGRGGNTSTLLIVDVDYLYPSVLPCVLAWLSVDVLGRISSCDLAVYHLRLFDTGNEGLLWRTPKKIRTADSSSTVKLSQSDPINNHCLNHLVGSIDICA